MYDNRSGITGILTLAGCAALFLLARRFAPSLAVILLWTAGIAVGLMLVLIGLVIYFTVADSRSRKDPDSPAGILVKARADLMELRRGQVKIKNRNIASLSREIIDIGEKIFTVLKQKPEKVADTRQFLNYYLPTLGKILRTYAQVEEGGSMTEELTENAAAHLAEIKKAMSRQYDSLFDDDKLDLTVDMEALTLACRRDGLLNDSENGVEK